MKNSRSATGDLLARIFRHRWFTFVVLCAGITAVSGFLFHFQAPKLRSFILVKIEKMSRDELPIRVLPNAINVHLFPLSATLSGIKVTPKKDLEAIIAPFEIDRVAVSLSLWQLLQGRLRVTEVIVSGSKISANFISSNKQGGNPLQGFFDALEKIPISRISVEQIALHMRIKSKIQTEHRPDLDIEVGALKLDCEKNLRALSADVDAEAVSVYDAKSGQAVQLNLNANLSLVEKQVTVTALKLRSGDSFLVASGELRGETEALKFGDINFSSRAEIHLEQIRSWAALLPDRGKKLPDLQGRVFIDTGLRREHGRNMTADFKVKTEALKVEKFFLDRVTTSGSYDQTDVAVPEFKLQNPAGIVSIKNFKLHLNEQRSFEGSISTSKLELVDLLKSLGVPKVPLWLELAGAFPCTGQFQPNLLLNCRGKISGRNLTLKDEFSSTKPIVAIREMQATGSFEATEKHVSYSADLTMPNSKGRSEGVIDYDQGFKIGYEASELNIKDIKDFAGLKVEGRARVKGTTEGDSHSATLAANVDGDDVWFEDYELGSPHFALTYEKGNLDFNDFKGHLSVSRYHGNVRVNLRKKEISADARLPFFNATDMIRAFSRKFKAPFTLTGTGQASIKVSGPFEFTKLSYDLKSSLFRAAVYGETFDQAHFDVTAKNGEVNADRVEVLKGGAKIVLTGTGHPDGTIKTMIQGRNLKLEETTTLANSGLSVSGLADFDMTLSGPVLLPDTSLTGHLTKTAVAEQGLADSTFRLKFTKLTIEGGGNFLGEAVRADFVLPLENNAPFSLKIASQDWNFAPLFAAVSGPGGRKDYEAALTTDISLSAPNGGFWNSSGQARIDKFSLSRGSLSLSAPKPVDVMMKNGRVLIQNFELLGDNTFFRISNSRDPKSKLDLQVNGKLDLNLLAMLTPFFEELRGALSFAFNVRSGPDANNILGSAYVEKGYLKFFEFPHPLEDINLDMLFNEKRILFNSVKGSLGGGRINASGNMEIKGKHDYPLNLTGNFEKISLNLPDKVRTTGSGGFSLTGKWFPLLLKGDYNVQQGLFTKEFTAEATANDGIRRDYFLPEFLLKENFVPLLVDLQIDFSRGIEMKNALVEGHILGSLAVKGAPGKPAISGTVTTDKQSKLTFKDNSFDIISSNVRFDGGPEINPKLYLAATSHVQDYDINLVVQGKASKPEFTWSSSPPLVEKDIISLLALGVTDAKLSETVTSKEQQASTGMQVGTGIIANNSIGKEIKDRFGANLQFSSGFDANTQSAVQRIIVSRQVNKRVDISATQAIGKVGETEAKVRYRLNEKMSLIGSWLGKQSEENTSSSDPTITPLQKNLNRFGLDVEYKFEFK